MLNDYGKLYLIGLVMILGTLCGIVLVLTDNATAGVGIMTSTIVGPLGYLTGNGVLAAKAEAPSPVFVPTPEAIASERVDRDEEREERNATGTE